MAIVVLTKHHQALAQLSRLTLSRPYPEVLSRPYPEVLSHLYPEVSSRPYPEALNHLYPEVWSHLAHRGPHHLLYSPPDLFRLSRHYATGQSAR